MYQLTDVTKLYAKGRRTVPAVRDLSLVIRDGEWLAIQGRTGHGRARLIGHCPHESRRHGLRLE